MALPRIAPIAAGPAPSRNDRAAEVRSRSKRRAPPRMSSTEGAKATTEASTPAEHAGRRKAHDGDGLGHRTGGDLAEGDRVEELGGGHPAVNRDGIGLHEAGR